MVAQSSFWDTTLTLNILQDRYCISNVRSFTCAKLPTAEQLGMLPLWSVFRITFSNMIWIHQAKFLQHFLGICFLTDKDSSIFKLFHFNTKKHETWLAVWILLQEFTTVFNACSWNNAIIDIQSYNQFVSVVLSHKQAWICITHHKSKTKHIVSKTFVPTSRQLLVSRLCCGLQIRSIPSLKPSACLL